MRVLVLGGAGFIGAHIVGRLASQGHEVTVFRRGRKSADLPSGVAVVTGDRNHLQASAAEFGRLRPDVVVDAIAFTAKQAEGLVRAFDGIARRSVVLSSGDVYRAYDLLYRRVDGPPDPAPLAESSRVRERLYPYRGVPVPAMEGVDWDDYDKILVERTARSNPALPATVLRLPMVYGPGDRSGRKRRFFAYGKRMADGRPEILLDRRSAQWRAPWGYVEDVAEAVRLAVENEQAAGRVYNVGAAGGLTLRSWIEELAAAVGWSGRVTEVDEECPPPSLPPALNLDQHLEMDSAKIRRELGYREVVSRREGLRRDAEWDRAYPPHEIDAEQFDYAAEDAILRRAAAEGSR